MPRKRDPFRCPECGSREKEPKTTWTIVSPLPDKYGRVTVTVMGRFECGECGKRWSSPIQKIKSGGEGREEREPREPGVVIEIDLSDLGEESE